MKIMADLDAVHLGLDENEADIAEELQDFDDSFDTRSEASESGSDSSDSQPSISSVSSVPSSIADKRKKLPKKKSTKETNEKKTASKRVASPAATASNGKNSAGTASTSSKKKRISSDKDGVKSAAAPADNKKSSNSENAKKSRKTSSGGMGAIITAPKPPNISGNKSDASDAEDKPPKPAPPTFDSDSESEDSDSAANIKRNGRSKAATKGASPEKKPGDSSSSKNAANKSYDYMTKINYLFRDTRFFLIKSNNADNIALSKTKNVWATLPQNDANLNQAFKEARNVLLIFSVNESGKFAGFARMSGQSRRDIPQVAWVLPPSISAKALGGVIELDWICRKELSFNCTSHLYNSWNEGKPVKIGRDGQEIEPKIGAELCRLFPEDEKVELTPILRKSKETAKMMREKGIRVIYKAPRSLSSRGGGRGHGHGGGGAGGGGGPMRHKRSYGSGGGGPHRGPYKMPPMGGPQGGGFKRRSSSPYRSGGPHHGGPGGGGSRIGGGDAGVPPWERWPMTSAAAAEAYVADYMRTMHGQLPPLPFVPPFGQLPLSAAGGSGALPPSGLSSYEQLAPPVRYYDGPPLPDYPPPQPMRPPPPGFDKGPSFEDFAAWKNAGLPTVPSGMPGFPGFSSNGLSASNGGGNSGSANNGSGSFSGGGNASGSSGGSNSYRNRDNNMNRQRERRDYQRGGGSGGGSSRNGGNDRERNFRGGNERGGHRNYRDGRR